MSIFTKIWAWVKKTFNTIKVDVAPIAVGIVEDIKNAEANGILPAIANALSTITGGLSVTINADIQAAIPNTLAALLALEGLPSNPTADQITAFENAVLKAISSKSFQQKSALWTTLAGQVYILIATDLKQNNGTLTFAQIVTLVEDAYQQYLADLSVNG